MSAKIQTNSLFSTKRQENVTKFSRVPSRLFCITNPDYTGSSNQARRGMYREKNSILLAVFRTTEAKHFLGRRVRVIRLCTQWTFLPKTLAIVAAIFHLLEETGNHLVIFAQVPSETIFDLHNAVYGTRTFSMLVNYSVCT